MTFKLFFYLNKIMIETVWAKVLCMLLTEVVTNKYQTLFLIQTHIQQDDYILNTSKNSIKDWILKLIKNSTVVQNLGQIQLVESSSRSPNKDSRTALRRLWVWGTLVLLPKIRTSSSWATFFSVEARLQPTKNSKNTMSMLGSKFNSLFKVNFRKRFFPKYSLRIICV